MAYRKRLVRGGKNREKLQTQRGPPHVHLCGALKIASLPPGCLARSVPLRTATYPARKVKCALIHSHCLRACARPRSRAHLRVRTHACARARTRAHVCAARPGRPFFSGTPRGPLGAGWSAPLRTPISRPARATPRLPSAQRPPIIGLMQHMCASCEQDALPAFPSKICQRLLFYGPLCFGKFNPSN